MRMVDVYDLVLHQRMEFRMAGDKAKLASDRGPHVPTSDDHEPVAWVYPLAQASAYNDVLGLDTAVLDSLRRILRDFRITPSTACVLLRFRVHTSEPLFYSGCSDSASSHVCCIRGRRGASEGHCL